MSPKFIVPFFLLNALFNASCTNSNEVKIKSDSRRMDLADKLFFFGPRLDSVNTMVIAECDCCGSEILFNRDSSFIAVSYCLEGDSYAKGKFRVVDKTLTLTFTAKEVLKLYSLEGDYDSSANEKIPTFQVINRQIPKSEFHISFLNSEMVLTTSGKEKDFGMENTVRSKTSFLDSLERDSVLYYLNVQQ